MRRKLKLTVVTSRRTANDYRGSADPGRPPEVVVSDEADPAATERLDLTPGVRSAIESLIAIAKEGEVRQ